MLVKDLDALPKRAAVRGLCSSPVVIVNLVVTLLGKRRLVAIRTNGFYSRQALTEVSVHRGA